MRSSILIKDMDMPKNCRECDFTHCTRFGQKLCIFLNESTSIRKKLPDCPLSEIQTPHGRLIDANKLSIDVLKTMNRETDDTVIGIIDRAPTIIEAEQGDG